MLWLLLACALHTPASAQVPAAFGSDRAPADVPFLAWLIEERLRGAPHTSPLPDDDALERAALLQPGTVYAEPRPLHDGEIDATWHRAITRLRQHGYDISLAQAHASFRQDLGLTRALPGIDVPPLPYTSLAGPTWASINLVKAGVDEDIFLKVKELVGSRHRPVAAQLAVALQLLREQSVETQSVADAYVDVWSAPLDRFMGARSLEGMGEEHVSHLMRLLENELSSWRERPASRYGLRQLPVALRVARTAAAYRSADYSAAEAAGMACHADGTVDPHVASLVLDDLDRPLCFASMTDRATFRWYMQALFDAMATHDSGGDDVTPGTRRLLDAVSRVRPAWLGVLEPAALRASLDTDIVSAALAQELVPRQAVLAATMLTLDTHAVDHLCRGDGL